MLAHLSIYVSMFTVNSLVTTFKSLLRQPVLAEHLEDLPCLEELEVESVKVVEPGNTHLFDFLMLLSLLAHLTSAQWMQLAHDRCYLTKEEFQ